MYGSPLWTDTTENITFPQAVISRRIVKFDYRRTSLILMSCSGIKSIALSILSRCFIFYSIKVILSVVTFDISTSRSKNYISLILKHFRTKYTSDFFSCSNCEGNDSLVINVNGLRVAS